MLAEFYGKTKYENYVTYETVFTSNVNIYFETGFVSEINLRRSK